jgi:chromosome segregation ATPase
VRKTYRELATTYSFLDDLDDIEKMTLQSDKPARDHHDPNNSSLLETSMLNSSLDSSHPRIFQVELLLRTSPLEDLSEDQVEHFAFFKEKLFGIITAESADLKKMEGSNLDVINEFRTKYTQYRERLREFEAVRERQQELKRIIDTLKEDRLRLFREGFGVINSKLKEVYQHLTRGGDAEL